MKKYLTKKRIICYLFCFILVCTAVLGITYARYRTEVAGAAAASTADVALNSSIDLSSALKKMVPGEKREILFSVTNQKDASVSEVAQEYSVSVTSTGNLPLTYELAEKEAVSNGTSVESPPSVQELSYVWTGGRLPHGAAAVHTYTLTVSWPAVQAAGSYADEFDRITLTVDAKQVKPKTN